MAKVKRGSANRFDPTAVDTSARTLEWAGQAILSNPVASQAIQRDADNVTKREFMDEVVHVAFDAADRMGLEAARRYPYNPGRK